MPSYPSCLREPTLLRLVLSSIFLGLPALPAHAQLGVYGKLDYSRYSQLGTSTSFFGGGAGIYDDFLHLGPIGAGIDLRGDLLTANNARDRDLLAGIRFAVKPPLLPIRPYVQGSIGIAGTEATGALAPGITARYNNKFTTGVFGGLDLTVFPHIDVRALELGYTRISGLSSSQFNLSSGLVLRF